MSNQGKKKTFSIIQYILTLILILSLFLIIGRLFVYHTEDIRQEELSKVVASYTVRAPVVTENGVQSVDLKDFVDITALQEINPDTAGYIQVDGTKISYPVMRSEEDNKYLRRDFYGKRSQYGSIYMDNASYQGGTNMVLYGHNMKSGKMFGELKSYRDTSFAEEHSRICYITKEQIRIYELCSVFNAPANDEELIHCLIPYGKDEFDSLMDYITKHGAAFYKEMQWGDELITLATCEYSHKNGRLFVVGRLVKKLERKN